MFGLQELFDKQIEELFHPNKLGLRILENEHEDADIPGYRLHPLKGPRKDTWSITVNGNWRVTFEFKNGDAYIVNYEDYH